MHKPRSHPNDVPFRLSDAVRAQAARRLRSRHNGLRNVWFGLAMSGLIGWSVAAPMLAGVALGMWLDQGQRGSHKWTLALLVAGLLIGCWNAWRWVEQEDHLMHREEKNHD